MGRRPQPIARRNNAAASVPAPVGGWNARDALANMEIADAVVLENMFPQPSNVVLRGGFSEYATGLPDQVETLMTYSGGGTEEFYAISDGEIYDVTSSGAVGAAVVSSLTNSRWQYTNVATAGGEFLLCVNGADDLELYDGATWTAINSGSSPAITGVDTDTLNNILLFKERVWFLENNTLTAWYLPTDSIAGAAQPLALRSFVQRGGYLVGIGTWTLDAGYGADDMLAFATSNGEIVVFRGTDPASAATWALVGTWFLGKPIGRRCFAKYGGDLLYICDLGLLPLSKVLQSAQVDYTTALTDKIQGAFNDATKLYGSTFGWQVYLDIANNAVHVNIPVSAGNQQQYVMNTTTQAWCNFTGWAANCWETYGNRAYFGGDTVVCRAWESTYTDNSSDIVTNALQAFNYFGQRGVEKYFTRARPSIFTDGAPAIAVGMNVNFDLENNTAPVSSAPISAGVWDTGVWDQDVWGAGLTVTNNWQGITGIGYCGAINLRSSSSGVQIEWAATDVVYQPGYAGI